MVLSDEDKAVIKHYCEKGHCVYRIWKDNPQKNWKKKSVSCLIRRQEQFLGTMDRQKGSGRPVRARAPENQAAVEEIGV